MTLKRASKKVPRRAVLQTLALGIGAVGLGRALFACEQATAPLPPREKGGGDDERPPAPIDDDEFVPGQSPPVIANESPPTVPNPTWEARVKQLESEQARLFQAAVFTQAAPGVWAGRERSHVPSATVLDEEGLKRVIVVVQHVMGKNEIDGGPYDGEDAGPTPVGDAGPVVDGGPTGDAAALDGGPDDAGTGAGPDAATDAGKGDGKGGGAGDAARKPEHYISTIYLRATVDGVETVVGLWEFASDSPAPPTVKFTLPLGVTSVTAYEWCTLHGLWAGTPVIVDG